MRQGRPPREADDIANLAFIGGRTNRTISDKAPSIYLQTLLEAGKSPLLAAQCVPTDDELLDLDNYVNFLATRRDLIADRLNAFLNTSGLDDRGDRLDPRLRELDVQITGIELELRRWIDEGLVGDAELLPGHVRQKVTERLAGAQRANPGRLANQDSALQAMLEFCDFRELQDVITARTLWDTFASRFGTKDNLSMRFGQLAALRNAIRHTRTVDEVTRKDGEVALLWFRQILAGGGRSVG